MFFLYIVLDDPQRKSLRLLYQVDSSIFSCKSCILSLEQIKLKTLVKYNNSVLNLFVKCGDGVKHIFSVRLISFLFVDFVEIELINLKGQDLSQCMVINVSCDIPLYGVLPSYFSHCVVNILADHF